MLNTDSNPLIDEYRSRWQTALMNNDPIATAIWAQAYELAYSYFFQKIPMETLNLDTIMVDIRKYIEMGGKS